MHERVRKRHLLQALSHLEDTLLTAILALKMGGRLEEIDLRRRHAVFQLLVEFAPEDRLPSLGG